MFFCDFYCIWEGIIIGGYEENDMVFEFYYSFKFCLVLKCKKSLFDYVFVLKTQVV